MGELKMLVTWFLPLLGNLYCVLDFSVSRIFHFQILKGFILRFKHSINLQVCGSAVAFVNCHYCAAKIPIRLIGISCFTTSTTFCYYTLTILLKSFHPKAEGINL